VVYISFSYSLEEVQELKPFDDERPEVLEEPVSVLKRGYPICNLASFLPIVTVGRMVRPKRHFPVCNLKTFRSLSY